MPKKEKSFSANELLFKQGEPCEEVLTILDGRVELFYEVNGKKRPVGRKAEDDVLGEQSILEGVHDISARALSDVTVLVQTKEEYIEQRQRSGELSPRGEAKESFLEDDDDDDDFNFSFSEDEEPTPPKRPTRPQRPSPLTSRRTSSTALSRRNGRGIEPLETITEEPATEQKEEPTALVKVEKQKKATIKAPPKPVIFPAEIKRYPLKEWLRENTEASVAFGPIVLLAGIERDEDDSLRQTLYRTLREVPNLQVKLIDKAISDSNTQRGAIQMRSWIEHHDADLGLYALLDNAGTTLEFHIVRPEQDTSPSLFQLGARFFLPTHRSKEQETLLKLFTISAMTAKRLEHEQLQKLFLPTLLKEVLAYASTPMIGLGAEEQGVNLVSFANLLSWISLINPEESYQNQASEIYKKALDLLPVYAPEYVFVNRQVGLLLQIEGEHKDNLDAFKVAEETFQKGLEAVSEKYQPKVYSDLNLRIGNVRQKIALQTGQAQDYIKAMTSYRDALKTINPVKETEQWADTINGLARTMQLLSSYSLKTTLLKKAVELYEKELTVVDKETSPFLWARACNNLASALFLLSEREANDPALLHRAVDVFSEALEVYDSLGAHQMAVVTDSNLKRAEKVLSKTEKELEKNKNWIDDILNDTNVQEIIKSNKNSTTPVKEEEPLLFEKIAIFEELEDDE